MGCHLLNSGVHAGGVGQSIGGEGFEGIEIGDIHAVLRLGAGDSVVEAGCGWAAYLMGRLDEKADVFRALAPMPMKPSDYIRRNCYFVAEPEERTIGAMLDLVGEDKILWGSDYPHVDSTLEAPKLIRQSIAGLSEQRQAAVMGENARKVFGL